jgi:DNA-binding IclR family transcriptional regulator
MAYAYYWSDPLIAQAMPKLIDLSRHLGETINLAQLSGQEIIYAVRLPCKRAIFAASVPGRVVPALCTSAGQAILSTFAQSERETAIREWPLHAQTPRTTMDRSEIADQIEHVVQNGFAITLDQMILDEIGIACAIRGPDGRAWAALHCSVSSRHWAVPRIKAELLPWLQDAANAISPMHRPV